MSRSPSPAPGRHSRLRSVSRASYGGPAMTVAGIAEMRMRARKASTASNQSLALPGSAGSRRASRRNTSGSRKPSVAGGGDGIPRLSVASVGSVKPRTSTFGMLNISTPQGRQSVMSSSSARSRKSRMSKIARKISIFTNGQQGVSSGAPPHREANGWQISHDKVCDRISCLFNCHTMADVLFRIGIRDIPAHKFILSTASPVFYMSLFENRPHRSMGSSRSGQPWRVSIATDGTQTPGTQSVGTSWSGGGYPSNALLRVSIDHYPFDAFFEFLRWLYTDDVMLSVSNVAHLIFMADEFKVSGLAERCFAFLRTEIRGETVLRILAIVRTLMAKAVISQWKEVVEQRRVMQQFKEMSLAERRHHLQNLAGTETGSSRGQSRVSSARNSTVSLTDYSAMADKRREMGSSVSGIYDIYADSATDVNASFDAVTGNVQLFQKKNTLFHQLTLVSEELQIRCWKCVREQTDAVVTGISWFQQPLRMVRAILGLDVCNVPEICLFRAMNEWAEKKCKEQGIPSLPEQRREVLGDDTIAMVRFPLLTLDQIQWEVVPAGLLSFKDVQSLQSIIAHKSPVLGKFSSEPRHFPISEMIRGASKRSSSKASTKTTTREDLSNIEDNSIIQMRLAAKTPVYTTEPGDEVDAILGSQLLRGYVDQTVEEHEINCAAFEAGAKAGGEESRAILCHSPSDKMLGRARKDEGSPTPGGSGDPHQQKTQHLSQMLMFTPSWLAQDIQDELVEEKAGDRNSRGGLSRDSPALTTYSRVGDIPTAPDFVRLSSGLYYFRGHQVLDMRIENGETMVYEHDMDDDDKSENSFGLPSAEDLKQMNEEAMREELGIAGKALPDSKVTLSSWLVRQ